MNGADALRQIDEWPVEHAAAAIVGPEGVRARAGASEHEFRLASISKVMSAYATLLLVEAGRLHLDDPVDPPGATVRHLLSHAAGYGFEHDAGVLAKPETRRIYSNRGFDVLGAHVERIVGQPFAEVLAESVFDPLDMKRTALFGSPAAGVRGPLVDVERFAAELLRPTLLSADLFREMIRPAFPDLAGVLPGFGRFTPLPWGLGVEIKGSKSPHWSGEVTSPRTFGHFGGSGTFLWVDPERALALVALADRDFGDWSKGAWPRRSDAVVAACERPR